VYETYQTYATIDRVFLALQSAYTAEADEITVTYDPAYGFPATVSIDYIIEAMDDELSYQVSDFQVLE
jgi:hypothetical protein